MVAPIKGPFRRTWGIEGPGSLFFKRRDWSTQAKPYTLSLPFHLYEGRTTESLPLGYTGYGASSYGVYPGSMPAAMNVSSVSNRCAAKLYGKLGESADLATTIAERRQAVEMIVKRAVQLRRGYQAVRKGNFKEAARVFGVTNSPKRVSSKKQVSNNWLEFHFGWVPLIKDIFAAVEVMQGPSPKRTIRAAAHATAYVTTSGGFPSMPPYGFTASKHWYMYSIRSGFTFQITNPDLFLANRLGLINPASVAWELVPFSFVVDWFIPVGAFLSSMTATVGLSVTDGWTSYRTFHQNHDIKLLNVSGKLVPASYFGWGVHADRIRGALSATPSLRPSAGFSPVRAFTAVTLLVQQMKGR